jgi:uncharacterized protein DUF2071
MAALVSIPGFSASVLGFLPVLVDLRVRDLLIASWETDRLAVERALPADLEPTDLAGRYLVSLVAFRVVGGRLGRLPVPPYSQLNARTYVSLRGEPAVFFLGSRVTAPGLVGRILGAPFRQARLRVRPGSVRAPGLGLSLVYRTGEPADAGLIGRHELGLFEARGLRALRIRRGAAEWQSAVLTEPARADILLALGFELRGDPNLLYAETASFDAEVPPPRLE